MATKRRQPAFGLARWTAEMKRVQRLRNEREVERFDELLRAVPTRGGATVSSKWFLAVLDAIVVAEDHGVYESLYNKLWSFPAATCGETMLRGLPKLIRRMNRHQQAERFLLGLESRLRQRRAFVAAFERASEADQRCIRSAFKEWSREHEAWEPLLRELGGTPFRAPTPSQPKASAPSWPPKWQRYYDGLMKGEEPKSFWEWRSRCESARFTAHLLSRPLGSHWRRAEAFTNPLFISFAMRYFGDFLEELEKLEPNAQRMASKQLVRVNRHRAPQGDWPDLQARARAIDRLVRARRSK